jgi:hypothetical protein
MLLALLTMKAMTRLPKKVFLIKNFLFLLLSFFCLQKNSKPYDMALPLGNLRNIAFGNIRKPQDEKLSVSQKAMGSLMDTPGGVLDNWHFIFGFAAIEAAGKWVAGTLYEDVDPFVALGNDNDPNHSLKTAATDSLTDLFKFALWDGFGTAPMMPLR